MLNEILPLYRLVSGCDYHRVLLPLGYGGYDFKICEGLTTESIKKFKVLFFNRVPLNIRLEAIKGLKRDYGTKIVMDLDDYWELYPGHYLYKRWMATETPRRIKEFIEVSDAVICTTERLAKKIVPYNSNVHVIPNALPFNTKDQFAFDNKTESDTVRFGFVGGTSHVKDLRSIEPVFQYFNNLDFTMCGFTQNSKEAIKMRDTCSNGQKNPNFKSVDMAPLDKYMYGYDQIDCCIAPLAQEEFNKYKSNLKIIEAGLKKCAIICSPSECYTDTVPDGVVTYCKSIKDWKEAIKKHKDKEYTKEKGELLHGWVKNNYDLLYVNRARLGLFEEVTNEKRVREI